MLRHALFVDLPNFYSNLLTCGIAEPLRLRDYFLHWLDLDRVARRLTGDFSSVWLFHSGRKLGPSTARIDGEYLREYVDRMNSLRGVTVYDVDIEGKQREVASYECEQCGHKGVAQWESEKGIDASLTVHLFDTMDTWDVACLLSADADFVPAVRTLRRRGKMVLGAGFSSPSSALVRECYDYIDLCSAFVEEDVAAYELFRDGGVVQGWLAPPVVGQSGAAGANPDVQLIAEWVVVHADLLPEYGTWRPMREGPEGAPYHRVALIAAGPVDLSSREQLVRDFQAAFPRYVRKIELVRGTCQFALSPLAWRGVERRLDAFGARLETARIEAPSAHFGRWTITYLYDPTAGGYIAVPFQPES